MKSNYLIKSLVLGIGFLAISAIKVCHEPKEISENCPEKLGNYNCECKEVSSARHNFDHLHKVIYFKRRIVCLF